MTGRETYDLKGIIRILCFITFLCISTPVFAQFDNNIIRTSVLFDTLAANSNREILFNSITITNLTNQKISVIVIVTPPKGWSSVTSKETTISLEGNQNTILPIRLSPSSSKTATWQTAQVEYRLNNNMTGTIDTFRVKVKEFAKFKATVLNSNTILASYQRNLTFPVYVKNMGNTPDKYTIHYTNDELGLNEKIIFPLKPGSDTTYNIQVKLSESDWSLLRKEDIKVLVSAGNEETINLVQSLSKIGSTLKENATAYLDMPLQFETGAMYQGNGNVQFYGGVRGTLRFANNDKLALDFRSNTYSAGQVIDNNIIRAEYTGAHWNAVAGNLMELTDFFMDGLGVKLGYKWSPRTYISGYSMLKSRIGDSKTAGINAGYRLKETIDGSSFLMANIDNVKQLNSFIAKQKLNFLFNEKGKLELLLGSGMEKTSIPLVGNANQTLIGSSYGYTFQWNDKDFTINSTVANNSNSFPGIYKGQRQQTHEIRGLYKSSFLGAFYEYTFRQQNFYLDTALYSDVFNIKTSNYGIRYGQVFKNINTILSIAQQQQEQPTDQAATQKYYYTYLNLNFSATLFKHLIISTNSYLGYGALNKPLVDPVLINSNQSSLQYKNLGISIRYDKGPYYYHEFIAYLAKPETYNRLILSPFVDLSLYNRALNFRAQFNYSKSTPNNTEISNVLGNVSYSNVTRGFDVNISGILPVKQLNSSPFFNASLRFRLHAPFVLAREYYDLKLILFKDKNDNGKLDQGEEPITDQTLSLNGNLFVTNEKGQVLFRNVSKGVFKGDFGYSSKIKGWIPVAGTLQSFEVSGNRTYYIPYKKSKVIQGKLTVSLDENSNLSFNVGNIKVTATTGSDTLVSFSTLTEENGEFYFNVPDGNYLVSLSPLAFDDNFQPVQSAQTADMLHNDEKMLYFEIKQKKRGINIRKKE